MDDNNLPLQQQRTTTSAPESSFGLHPDRFNRVTDDNNNNDGYKERVEEYHYQRQQQKQERQRHRHHRQRYNQQDFPAHIPSLEEQRRTIEYLSAALASEAAAAPAPAPAAQKRQRPPRAQPQPPPPRSTGKRRYIPPPVTQEEIDRQEQDPSCVMIMYQGQYAKRPNYTYRRALLNKMKLQHPVYKTFNDEIEKEGGRRRRK
eukprot:TRINITY_DN27692_c0_g1_i1.p1 TRINITY_DN27692_c0_g1~~TRINITY_DN27692_c0_g1_i1.p1  ORF type:complete len:210 (+),score=42.89 TRINITY_DN27692_c0_g1_i1:22-630(+)